MKKLIQKIQATHAGVFVSLLRITIGLIFFKAGSGKLFGWFGGFGIEGVTSFFTKLGIPFPLFNAYLVGSTEWIGGILMTLGLFTRLVSIPFCIIMVMAIFTAHKDGDFYYPLMILMSSLALLEIGGGILSIDKLCSRQKNERVIQP